MDLFIDRLRDEFGRKINGRSRSAPYEILDVFYECCEILDVGNDKQISSHSLLAELCDGTFAIAFHFGMNQKLDGGPADFRSSLECEFELPGDIDIEDSDIEYDDAYTLKDMFSELKKWEVFEVVGPIEMDFEWFPPEDELGELQ